MTKYGLPFGGMPIPEQDPGFDSAFKVPKAHQDNLLVSDMTPEEIARLAERMARWELEVNELIQRRGQEALGVIKLV